MTDFEERPKAVYLGTEPDTGPGWQRWIKKGVEDVAEAQSLFLVFIQKYARSALEDLAQDCLPAMKRIREKGVTPDRLKKLHAAIRDWAIIHHLTLKSKLDRETVPDWVLQQANETLRLWADSKYAKWAGKSWIWYEGYPREIHCTLDLPNETKEKLAIRYKHQALGKGLSHPSPTAIEHFVWAVRFQVAGWEINDIAYDAQYTRLSKKREKADQADLKRIRENVRLGVKGVLQLIGLTQWKPLIRRWPTSK